MEQAQSELEQAWRVPGAYTICPFSLCPTCPFSLGLQGPVLGLGSSDEVSVARCPAPQCGFPLCWRA